jgi:translation elongation factor EF-G
MPHNIANIRASVPAALEGEVMQHMNRLGAKITAVESEKDSRTAIGATIPRDQIAALRRWLTTYTDGRASLVEI